MLDKVSARLSKWDRLLPQLSYRGRVLVANNLASSTLWHRCIVLDLPEDTICEIQRKFVNFFWSGEQWVRASVNFFFFWQFVREDMAWWMLRAVSMLSDFKKQKGFFIIKTYYGHLAEGSWAWTIKPLFLMRLEDMDLSGITPFYQKLFHMWRNVLKEDRDRSSFFFFPTGLLRNLCFLII